MKKKFLLVMIALLSVTLLFFACSSSDDDDDPPPPPNLSSAAALTSVLTKTIDFTSSTGEGTTTDPITGEVTVSNGETTVAATDFVASVNATVTVYTGNFTSAAGSVTLTPNDDTDVYVLVTAEDGTTKKYYTITVTEPLPVPGSVSVVNASVPGVDPVAGVEAEYEITITAALTASDRFIFTNVATSGPIVYAYNAGTDTDANQATAVVALINAEGTALYSASNSGAVITLVAKATGVIDNAPAVEADDGAGGSAASGAVDPVNPSVPGITEVIGVEAEYTVTIEDPILTGEKIVFENVAGANVEYPFGSETTADAQATAAAAAINAAGGALYDASAAGATITLVAKTPGVIATAPTATVE
jgi:hypothetical protein